MIVVLFKEEFMMHPGMRIINMHLENPIDIRPVSYDSCHEVPRYRMPITKPFAGWSPE